jgi:hypothetical protein
VFDEETTALLASGCALIIGTVAADGEPHAGRGWGLHLLEDGEVARLRLLLDVGDERTVEHAAAGGALAVTATSVRDLRSVQLKGRSTGIEVAGRQDLDRAEGYTDAFFADIHETDGTSYDLLRRFVPLGYVACAVEATERYDQTPGPGAGARLGARAL